MTLYAGPTLGRGAVRLATAAQSNAAALADADVRDNLTEWLAAARRQDDIVYFEIHESERPVGQIFLHDIDPDRGEALIGYHLFRCGQRGCGIGTQALSLLVEYVRAQTDLAGC